MEKEEVNELLTCLREICVEISTPQTPQTPQTPLENESLKKIEEGIGGIYDQLEATNIRLKSISDGMGQD